MGWSLRDFEYFKDLEQLHEWLSEIILEMKREKQMIERSQQK
ncbi:hypothetical protein [Brasilonema sp. UFV-L1]